MQEGKVKNLEEVSEKYNDEVEVPEEELSQSIFVSDEFAVSTCLHQHKCFYSMDRCLISYLIYIIHSFALGRI